MTLALAHSPAQAFYPDLYVAVAGVIPVLFVALVLQISDLLDNTADATERLRELYGRKDGTFMAPKVIAAAVWPVTALFIIFAGADGELAAISALASRHPSHLIAVTATSSVAFLTIAVVAGPFGLTGMALLRLLSVMVLGLFGRIGPEISPVGQDAATRPEDRTGAPAPNPDAAAGEAPPSELEKTGPG